MLPVSLFAANLSSSFPVNLIVIKKKKSGLERGGEQGFRIQADLALPCNIWGEGYNLLLQGNLEYSFAVFRSNL